MRRHHAEVLSLPAPSATIAVVADTHSRPHTKALQGLRGMALDAILHAGDIGDRAVIDALEAIAPTYAVRGNIDAPAHDTSDSLCLDVEVCDQLSLRILLTHIAVRGPRLRKDARELAKTCDADMVVCGHSHVPLMIRDAGFIVFNPGSMGPRRFHLPITYGVMELGQSGWKLRHVDCTTGKKWLPPQA
jgi:uncharacterized protein